MNVFKSILVAVAIWYPLTTNAQVVNGDFSGGATGWTWSQVIFSSSINSCSGAAYTPYNPSGGDVPFIYGSGIASGNAGRVTAGTIYSNGSWASCRTISQTVFVPSGKRLKFALKIGADLGRFYTAKTIASGTFWVFVTDISTNVTTSIFHSTGYSQQTCGSFCPVFAAYSLDMSAYWGKNVKITFAGDTHFVNGSLGIQEEPTMIYLDSVALQ